MTWKATIAAAALSVGTFSALTYAQNQPGGNNAAGNNGGGNNGGGGGGGQNGGGGGGGRRGNFDPAQMQQRMMDNIKDQLGATDDEWNVIQPKLQKVMDAQRETRAGGGMRMLFGGGRGGRGGGGGGQGGGGQGGGDQPTSPLAQASEELQTVLQNKNATPDDINSKLTAFRAARDKANTDLDAARKDLKDVLTAKQEAQMVLFQILE